MKVFTSKKLLPAYWILLSIMILVANHSDPYFDFPLLFVIPVLVASWYNGRWWGLALGIFMPAVRLYLVYQVWEIPSTLVHPLANALTRTFVLVCFALLADVIHRQRDRIKAMEGLLPICRHCKRIRDDNNQWQPVDVYLNQHAGTVFLQGLCSDCARDITAQLSQQ
jgi:hypothetical protein